MRRVWTRILTTAVCGFCAVLAAEAGPVTLPVSTWVSEPFTLMPSGGFFPDVYIASMDGSLLLTGYYVTGDYYRVYVNGNLALTTSQVLPTDVDYGDRTPSLYTDPASAYRSGLFSTGSVAVHAGDMITIADLYPPGGIGEAAVQQVTPEPGTVLLLGCGFLAVLALRRAGRSIAFSSKQR